MRHGLRIEVGVGLVFFTAMAILAYYSILKSHEVLKPKDTYTMKAEFFDASGLEEKSKVLVNGVEAGRVTSITLLQNRVVVEMTMHHEFILYDNYRLLIQSEAALGGKLVAIYPGTQIDQEGDSHDLVARESMLQGTLNDPLASISQMIEENRENVYLTINNLRQFSEKLNSADGTVAKLMHDDKLATQAEDLMSTMKETVEDAREQAPVTSFIRAALTAF